MSAVFTAMKPDYWSGVLGTNYNRFESRHGIDGLCRVRGYEVDLLAVYAKTPGTGQFRRFIEACKEKYDRILVWEVHNEMLPAVLIRYGFKPYSDFEEGTDIKLNGYEWRKL